MFAIFDIGRKLFEKLRRKSYRQAYMSEHVRRGIAYQIRALRDQRGWNQGEFSKRIGKPQSVVCRLEDPSYGKMTVQTLLEIANVCDVALQVMFVSYSTFLRNTRDISSSAMKVPSFEDELQEPASVEQDKLGRAIEAFSKLPEQRVPVFSAQSEQSQSLERLYKPSFDAPSQPRNEAALSLVA